MTRVSRVQRCVAGLGGRALPHELCESVAPPRADGSERRERGVQHERHQRVGQLGCASHDRLVLTCTSALSPHRRSLSKAHREVKECNDEYQN
jgi:hypothetical protein